MLMKLWVIILKNSFISKTILTTVPIKSLFSRYKIRRSILHNLKIIEIDLYFNLIFRLHYISSTDYGPDFLYIEFETLICFCETTNH